VYPVTDLATADVSPGITRHDLHPHIAQYITGKVERRELHAYLLYNFRNGAYVNQLKKFRAINIESGNRLKILALDPLNSPDRCLIGDFEISAARITRPEGDIGLHLLDLDIIITAEAHGEIR